MRTDPQAKAQRGISFLLIDMKSPGITVRPIITLDGEHEVNEVFFDNVEVPAENLIGEENRGFKLAMMTLDRTRPGVAAMAVGIGRAAFERTRNAGQARYMGATIAACASGRRRCRRVGRS